MHLQLLRTDELEDFLIMMLSSWELARQHWPLREQRLEMLHKLCHCCCCDQNVTNKSSGTHGANPVVKLRMKQFRQSQSLLQTSPRSNQNNSFECIKERIKEVKRQLRLFQTQMQLCVKAQNRSGWAAAAFRATRSLHSASCEPRAAEVIPALPPSSPQRRSTIFTCFFSACPPTDHPVKQPANA